MNRAGWAVLASVGAAVLLGAAAPAPPAFRTVRASYRRSDAVLLDRWGRPLQELRVDPRQRVLDWVPLSATSSALQEAVIASEDRRFYRHHGVDLPSVASAAWQTLRGHKRGASTITMQLAALLDPGLRRGKGGRTVLQKLDQMRLAWSLERRWSKSQILEAYLNLCSTRGELRGIDALSRGLFGKGPDGLDADEAAVLAALLRAPGASPKRVAWRAAALERQERLAVNAKALASVASSALRHPPAIAPDDDAAPEAARRLLPQSVRPGAGDLEVRSSLDGGLQRFVAQTLRSRLGGLSGENVRDAAALVVDNATGEVLAYVGNTGSGSSARFVDGIQAPRQAGSTLKPFLYALAFEQRLITPASLLNDSPLELFVGRGLYRPEDYEHSFLGPIPASVALASSVNVPAVRLLELVGEEPFVDRLSAVGFADLEDADYYGPSLALGTADVSLWDEVTAYRALARGGLAGPLSLTPVEGRPVSRRVYTRQAAFLVSDVLSDRENRSATFGLDSPLATSFWTAVKTGTSKDMRDNWCVGFSRRYTVGVWVGNFSGASMWDVSGISGAAPAWLDIMDYLEEGRPHPAPEPPPGLVRRGVRFPSGETRLQWFLRGTEPLREDVEPVAKRPRVERPVSGTTIAVDPDIPPGVQAVPFVADSGSGLRWRLNGNDLGPADRAFEWPPVPGDYALSLVDQKGRRIDGVSFSVRGALLDQESDDSGSPKEADPVNDSE